MVALIVSGRTFVLLVVAWCYFYCLYEAGAGRLVIIKQTFGVVRFEF